MPIRFEKFFVKLRIYLFLKIKSPCKMNWPHRRGDSQMDDNATQIAIDVEDVTKIYGTGSATVTALRDISLQIRDNEFFTLLDRLIVKLGFLFTA